MNHTELAKQAFCGMHPALWNLMKDRGFPNWRSEGCHATQEDAEKWISLVPESEIKLAVGVSFVAKAVLAACQRQQSKGRSLDNLNLNSIVENALAAQMEN